jgi:hypothetical protein
MRLLSLILAAACLPLPAQDDIDPRPRIAKDKYEPAIRRIAGVKDITVGGINGKRALVITVESDEVKKDVATLTNGALDGVAITFVVSPTTKTSPVSGPCAGCVCPCHRKPGSTVAEPAKPREEPKAEELCDVVREAIGQKGGKGKDRCEQMVGWTNDPQKIEWVKKEGLPHWQSKEMGMPGMICYTYIKHRAACPINKRKLEERVKEITPGK